jgi:hypothetical protein
MDSTKCHTRRKLHPIFGAHSGLCLAGTNMVDLEKSLLKRNDLRCPGAPVCLDPNAGTKLLCFQSLFSVINDN